MALNLPLKHGLNLVNVIADPAPGAGFIFSVSPRRIEQLYSIFFLLDTDGTPADRRLSFRIDDGVNVEAVFPTDISIVANTITQVSWLINGPSILDTTAALVDIESQFLPPDYIIPLGGRLFQVITNLQAGDQISQIRVITKTWSRT